VTIEILEHPADVGFTVHAATLADAFAEAARALYVVALEGEASVGASLGATGRSPRYETITVELENDDLPSLLVDFLSELLYLLDTGRFVAAHTEIRMTGPAALHATLHGEPRDPARHPWRLIVKAVTYHRLAVQPSAAGWEARVFLDI
jgi:SHS2 domain-containing protein